MTLTPTARDINTVVGTTPFRIDLPDPLGTGKRITTVRGGVGTPDNDSVNPSTDFSQDQKPFTDQERQLVLFADVGAWRVLVGSMAPQTFADSDIALATDLITLVGHGFVTGDGPLRFNSSDTLPDVIIALNASGVLTATAIIDTDTVTIDSKVYTFQDTLTDVDGNVHVGADDEASLLNLLNAINLGPGQPDDYADAMTIHPTVKATLSDATTLTVAAKDLGGTGGTLIATTESAGATWAETTLDGGQELFVVRVDDDTFQVALTRALALAGTVLDFTDDGTGTHTVTGMHNVAAVDPTVSVLDGSSGLKIPVGQSLTILASKVVTVVAFNATDALTFFFA